jgi:hypothetical protein
MALNHKVVTVTVEVDEDVWHGSEMDLIEDIRIALDQGLTGYRTTSPVDPFIEITESQAEFLSHMFFPYMAYEEKVRDDVQAIFDEVFVLRQEKGWV